MSNTKYGIGKILPAACYIPPAKHIRSVALDIYYSRIRHVQMIDSTSDKKDAHKAEVALDSQILFRNDQNGSETSKLLKRERRDDLGGFASDPRSRLKLLLYPPNPPSYHYSSSTSPPPPWLGFWSKVGGFASTLLRLVSSAILRGINPQ
ncbi:hypothetical protein LguiA_007874 [Lonicera macranthoides]